MTILDQKYAFAKSEVERLGISSEYPFSPNYLSTPMGAMHYVDEGEGHPILAMHGNPTWSFLYRKFITELSGDYRVVVPDHIGFGLSDKPEDVEQYTIEAHIQNIEYLMEKLDLNNVTLIVQDWGGPIGLGAAARHPKRIKAIVVLNSFGFYPLSDQHDPENVKLPPPLVMMRTKFPGAMMVRNMGMFERMAMPTAVARGDRLKAVKKAYTGVFQSSKDRAGVLAFPRLIPTRTQHPSAKILINETGPYLENFKGPAHIFWGMEDPFFPVEALETWQKKLPQAGVTQLAEAKHYIQEDAYEDILPELRVFLNNTYQ